MKTVLAGRMPDDRLPVIEWATWWHLTLERWRAEGLPAQLEGPGIKRHLGLDVDYQLWLPQFRGASRRSVASIEDYLALLPELYPGGSTVDLAGWQRRAVEQAAGEAVVWATFEGFFWWPRVLLGIEPHLYAFYDRPGLLHRINQDQVAHIHRCLDRLTEVFVPDFVTLAEDMSYNHGPMISREQFEEFLLPYYRQIIPRLHELGCTVLVDSDGDVEPLIPWLLEGGIDGILPLERMAGVDVARVRERHPEWLMVGGFDKTVMKFGASAMREEFERLLPAMRLGRFIPSVDHQTPPDVSLEQYRQYVTLLHEYAAKAVRP